MSIAAELRLSRQTISHPDQLMVHGRFVNKEPADLSFNTSAVSTASLALEVRTMDGRIVSLGPPPTPPSIDVRVDLPPGKSFVVTFRRFLPARLGPGAYQIRLRYVDISAEIHSFWKTFRLRP